MLSFKSNILLQRYIISLFCLCHGQEMSTSQSLIQAQSGERSRCHGNPLFFFFSYNLVTRNQEKEKVELKPVAKAREERIVVIWRVFKKKKRRLFLCVRLTDWFVHSLLSKLTGNSPGSSLPVTHLAPLIKTPITDSAQTAVFHQSVRPALKE